MMQNDVAGFTNDRLTCFPSLLPLPLSIPVTSKKRQASFPIENNQGLCAAASSSHLHL